METAPIIIERIFNASVSRVWQALTDVEEFRNWYFDISEFKPIVGFEFQFEGIDKEGKPKLHLCRIEEVIPQKKLAYTWRYAGYPGNSLVTFELFDEGGKTRLRLTHEGLDTFPKIPTLAKENFIGGWTSIIGDSLKNFVEHTR